MSQIQYENPHFPPVRACIFDVDGLLINSEDIYTDIYNNILRSYGKPDLPWSVKAKQQSRGREGTLYLLSWAHLSLTYDEWASRVRAQHDRFKACMILPGVADVLTNLAKKTIPTVHLAIASSASRTSFQTKTSHLPLLTDSIPPECRVFGDDSGMRDACKKPAPDIFLLALRKINTSLLLGQRWVRPEECLVFEDSVAGVEAGRRAGMRVIWVPHSGLRGVWRGREETVLMGKGEGEEDVIGQEGGGKCGEKEGLLQSNDGWAEMLMSLEDFQYQKYGIQLQDHG